MRSGRGKCPQCKEIIVVDLEAPEIRCPFCGALLKKSAKTVAEVRAAEEERIKAAKAREEAIEEEKAESAAPAAAPEAENPAPKEEAAFPSVMTEDERSEAEFGETALKNEALNAANEMSDEELAMMDEALPEGSELLSGEAPEAEVQTDPEETVVYSSVSMEDDAPAEEENPSDEAAEEEENTDLSANAEVTLEDDGSSFDEALPSDLIEDEAPAEENAEESAKETAGSEADVSDADAALFDDEAPAFLTESETSEETAPAEEAVSPEVSPAEGNALEETPAEENALEETPAEEIASTEEIPAEDAVSPEEIKVPAPAEDAPLEERAEEGALPAEEEVPEGVAAEENAAEGNALEIASPEEYFGEEAPVSEEESAEGDAEQEESGESAIEVESSAESADANKEDETAADSGESESEGAKEAEEAPQYTAEDMAFAASLSDVRRKQYVAPTSKGAQKAIKAERPAKKKAAQAGGKNSMGIYKKPIAAIIMLLSIVGVLFYLAYGLFITRWFDYGALALTDGISADLFAGSPSLLGQLPKSWIGGIAGILPVFGGEYFLQYLTIILAGIVGLISILGITGKKGKLGFIFILLADAVWCVLRLWSMHGGVPYFFEMDSMAKIIADYGKYIEYGIYGLLLLGGILIVISFASGSSEFEMTIGSAILPIIYMAILVAGYVALLVLPGMMKFTISATIMRYILFGVWGLTLLLTIVGVHSSTLSRGVNGYLSCAVLLAITLMFATNVVISYVAKEADVSALITIFTAIVPGLALMPLASFAAADLRN